MNRRQLLRTALGLAALPAFSTAALSTAAFASGNTQEQRAALSEAWRLAAQRRVPMLVLVIPQAESDRWPRGQVLGEWLNNATDAELAPLSRVEVVCGSVSDVKRLVPGLKASEDAWFLWVDPHAPETAQALALELPSPPANEPQYGDPDYGFDAHEQWERARIAQNTQAIQDLLAPLFSPLGAVAEGAGAAVRASLVEEPPRGAHWGVAGACGMHVEGVETGGVGILCGMGHVSAASRRFLYFIDVSTYRGF